MSRAAQICHNFSSPYSHSFVISFEFCGMSKTLITFNENVFYIQQRRKLPFRDKSFQFLLQKTIEFLIEKKTFIPFQNPISFHYRVDSADSTSICLAWNRNGIKEIIDTFYSSSQVVQ
jgi:hypothetical protein